MIHYSNLVIFTYIIASSKKLVKRKSVSNPIKNKLFRSFFQCCEKKEKERDFVIFSQIRLEHETFL